MPILCCPGVKPLSEHAQCETLTGHIFKSQQKKYNKKKKRREKCLPLSKLLLLLLLLEPSALIVRKLRVLVNNDQIYFFVFSLMTADIEQENRGKTMNCKKMLNMYCCFI